ncbi:predicted protein [Streptomyces sp. SPB78]|nr:predicted protein [Streptomyces sp. SPB78]
MRAGAPAARIRTGTNRPVRRRNPYRLKGARMSSKRRRKKKARRKHAANHGKKPQT